MVEGLPLFGWLKGSLFEEVTLTLNCNDEKGTNENTVSERTFLEQEWSGKVLRVGTGLARWNQWGCSKGGNCRLVRGRQAWLRRGEQRGLNSKSEEKALGSDSIWLLSTILILPYSWSKLIHNHWARALDWTTNVGTYLALCIDTEINRGKALLLDKKPFTCPASELP